MSLKWGLCLSAIQGRYSLRDYVRTSSDVNQRTCIYVSLLQGSRMPECKFHSFNDRAAAMYIICLSTGFCTECKISPAYTLCCQRPLSMSLRKYICRIFRHQMQHSVNILVCNRTIYHYQICELSLREHTLKL